VDHGAHLERLLPQDLEKLDRDVGTRLEGSLQTGRSPTGSSRLGGQEQEPPRRKLRVRRNGPARRRPCSSSSSRTSSSSSSSIRSRRHPSRVRGWGGPGGVARTRGVGPTVSGRDAGKMRLRGPMWEPLGPTTSPGGRPADPQRAADGRVGPAPPRAAPEPPPAPSRPRMAGRTPPDSCGNPPRGEVEADVAAEGGGTPAQAARNRSSGPKLRGASITSSCPSIDLAARYGAPPPTSTSAAGRHPSTGSSNSGRSSTPSPGGSGGSKGPGRGPSVSRPAPERSPDPPPAR
jgi:hypothetical protein